MALPNKPKSGSQATPGKRVAGNQNALTGARPPVVAAGRRTTVSAPANMPLPRPARGPISATAPQLPPQRVPNPAMPMRGGAAPAPGNTGIVPPHMRTGGASAPVPLGPGMPAPRPGVGGVSAPMPLPPGMPTSTRGLSIDQSKGNLGRAYSEGGKVKKAVAAKKTAAKKPVKRK